MLQTAPFLAKIGIPAKNAKKRAFPCKDRCRYSRASGILHTVDAWMGDRWRGVKVAKRIRWLEDAGRVGRCAGWGRLPSQPPRIFEVHLVRHLVYEIFWPKYLDRNILTDESSAKSLERFFEIFALKGFYRNIVIDLFWSKYLEWKILPEISPSHARMSKQ